jgi:protein NrfD
MATISTPITVPPAQPALPEPSTSLSAPVLWQRGLWIAAILGLAAGIFGASARLTEGHLSANYGSYVPWGLWIALYVAGVGAAGGAFAVAAMAYLGGVRSLRSIAPLALVTSAASMAAGLSFVWLDLGHPMRALNLLFYWSPRSMMSWMTLFYGLFGLVLVGMLFAIWRGRERWLRPLAAAGTVIMVAFAGGEGALFGVLGARPYWNSGMRPIEFLVAGLLAGIAAVAVAIATVAPRTKERNEALRVLRPVLIGLALVNALLLWAEVSVSLYAAVPSHANVFRLLLSGPYAWVFWLLQLGAGLVLPLALLLLRRDAWAVGTAGAAVIVGYIAGKLNMVIPGLVVPEFENLAHAFYGERLSFSYVPSAAEWLLAAGVLGIALVLFLAGTRLLSGNRVFPNA